MDVDIPKRPKKKKSVKKHAAKPLPIQREHEELYAHIDYHYAGAALDDGDDLDEIIDKIEIENF